MTTCQARLPQPCHRRFRPPTRAVKRHLQASLSTTPTLSARASRCPPPTMDALSAASARPHDLASTTSRSPWAGRTVTALTATSVLLAALIPLRVRSRAARLPCRHGRSSLLDPLQRHQSFNRPTNESARPAVGGDLLRLGASSPPFAPNSAQEAPRKTLSPSDEPKSARRGGRRASSVATSRAGTHGSTLPRQTSPLRLRSRRNEAAGRRALDPNAASSALARNRSPEEARHSPKGDPLRRPRTSSR